MKNDPLIYTMTKAIEYPRKMLDTSQQKKYTSLRQTNFDIIMTSQTSSLSIAIKSRKQPKHR